MAKQNSDTLKKSEAGKRKLLKGGTPEQHLRKGDQSKECQMEKGISRIKKHILIEFDGFSEFFEEVDISACVTSRGQLVVKRLLKTLERKFNVFTIDKQVKVFLPEGAVWLTIPKKALMDHFSIDFEEEFSEEQSIKLQLFKEMELIDVAMEDEVQSSDNEDIVEDENDFPYGGQQKEEVNSDEEIGHNSNINREGKEAEGRCRRLKERKIKHVIEKVLKWRELYAGINSEQKDDQIQGFKGYGSVNETVQRVPLQEGARMVKISKKTLDDYLSQLKKGKKYGFNFNDHKNEKIGVLREFIRKIQKRK